MSHTKPQAEDSDSIKSLAVTVATHALGSLSEEQYLALSRENPDLFDALLQRQILLIAPKSKARLELSLKQTPLGVLPLSVIESLGIAEKIYSAVISNLEPYCDKCQQVAIPPGNLANTTFPNGGVVAISVVGDDDQFSLRERCEWLGSERAIISDKLVSASDLSDSDQGEPVIALVANATEASLSSELSKWFARGGSEARITHFKSRDSKGVELARVKGSWSCPKCDVRLADATRLDLERANRCGVCKGAGWLISGDDTRLVACRDCIGFGVVTPMANYRFNGLALRDLATLSFDELVSVGSKSLSDELKFSLNTIIGCGFGEYPLGAAVEFFSRGELALLSIASAELSGLKAAKYLVDRDLGDIGLTKDRPSFIGPEKIIVLSAPTKSVQVKVANSCCSSSEKSLVLRDIRRGPIELSEARFPLEGISAIRGGVGGGKSLLLKIIAERFQKRKKFEHIASFGDLKRCELVSSEIDSEQTVLEALGFAEPLAREIARTRRAQELGLLESDLVLPNSLYRCTECGGGRVRNLNNRVTGEVKGALCPGCFGALYDWQVAELLVGNSTVGELMLKSIRDLADLPWLDHSILDLKLELPDELANAQLSTSLRELARSDQRLIAIIGGCIRSFNRAEHQKGRGALTKELILIDGPKELPESRLGVLSSLLSALNDQGATVVYADMAEALESRCSYVLELPTARRNWTARACEVYLDRRYAR
jgi:Zn-finger nucleic acid-binding protein